MDDEIEDPVSSGVVHGEGRHGGEGQSHGEAGEDGFGDHLDRLVLGVRLVWEELSDYDEGRRENGMGLMDG